VSISAPVDIAVGVDRYQSPERSPVVLGRIGSPGTRQRLTPRLIDQRQLGAERAALPSHQARQVGQRSATACNDAT
jgi:hypothetical protein